MTKNELAIPGVIENRSAVLGRIWLLVIFVAAVVFVSMAYIYYTGRRMATVHAPLIDAAMEIKLEATTAHLWFEEAISDDRTVAIDDVLKHLDEADWYAKAMLEGGTNAEGTFHPMSDSQMRESIGEVRKKLAEFKDVALERWKTRESAGIGSEIDQRFDLIFKDLLERADIVETDLQRVTAQDLKHFGRVQAGLMASCIFVTIGVGAGFSRFVRRQISDAEKLQASNQQLDAANQQLTASEQQLRASNQQLTANEQQLRAANQQLTANEQQLRAANQQLTANEQQLRASNQQLDAANQQLTASEQQLKASNQQLTANEQQLKASNQQLTASEQQVKASNQQLTATNQQLRASQKEISALAKFPAENPNPVLRVAKDGRIVYANEASESLLNHWGSRVGEQLPDELCRIASDVFNSGRTKEIDADYERGSQLMTFAPVKDLGHVNVYSLDITKRKKAEEQLRQTRANLEHTARLVTAGEMASGLAHELNQPLCAIMNYANAALRATKANAIEQDQLVEILSDIATQTDRAGEIIRRLRRLVRKREPKRSSVNINEIVAEVINLEQAEALERRTEVLTELADGIKHIMADDIQIEQVILNLVRNGFEAMAETPRESRRLTIRTSAVDGDKIEVAVCDNGKGIPKDAADRIFDPFFSTRAEGLGVGLSLSRSIIEAHGGKIWAEPNEDCGATVRFTLPMKGIRNG